MKIVMHFPDLQNQIGRVARMIPRILLELSIVFCGVYFAFLFNEYSNDREQKQNQIQLLQALDKEVSYFLDGEEGSGAHKRNPVMQQIFNDWQGAVQSGERKVPLYFEMRGNALPTKSMWQVVLYFDGLNLIDVPLMFELSKYYNSFDIMLSKYQRLIDFAEAEIIPFEDKPDYFYQNDGKLLPKYAAYVKRYEDFLGLFTLMIKESERLKEMIRAKIE